MTLSRVCASNAFEGQRTGPRIKVERRFKDCPARIISSLPFPMSPVFYIVSQTKSIGMSGLE